MIFYHERWEPWSIFAGDTGDIIGIPIPDGPLGINYTEMIKEEL